MAEPVSKVHPRTQLDRDFGWFNRHANLSRYLWRGTKVVATLSALAASGVILLTDHTGIAAGLAVLTAVLEVVDATGRSQESWLRYRVAAERLRIEQGLYDGGAGPYSDAADTDRLLAERLAAIRRGELRSLEQLWRGSTGDAEMRG
jgi:hypothetical protein